MRGKQSAQMTQMERSSQRIKTGGQIPLIIWVYLPGRRHLRSVSQNFYLEIILILLLFPVYIL
ncbi:hypothetical protein FQZ97_796940 [compost metagenome]